MNITVADLAKHDFEDDFLKTAEQFGSRIRASPEKDLIVETKSHRNMPLSGIYDLMRQTSVSTCYGGSYLCLNLRLAFADCSGTK
jgi:hypothetical protein